MYRQTVCGAALVMSKHDLRRRPLHDWLEDFDGQLHVALPGAAARDAPVIASDRQVTIHDMGDYEDLRAELAMHEIAKHGGVDRLASSAEMDVIRAARLRELLGIDGQGLASARAYRDKVTMKELARSHGVRVAPFRALHHPGDLCEFLDDVGYPLVVKPRLGGDSQGVAVLAGDADLDVWLASGHLRPSEVTESAWLAEAFVSAPMFHVDGLMEAGRVMVAVPSAYSSGNFEAYSQRRSLLSIQLDDSDPRHNKLVDFAAAVIAALPGPPVPTAFHLEAWLPSNDEPVLCEVACRVGGGGIATALEARLGYHLAEQSLRSQIGLPLRAPREHLAQAAGLVILQPHSQSPPRPQPPPDVPGLVGSGPINGPAPAANTTGVCAGSTSWVVTGPDRTAVSASLQAIASWWDGLHERPVA